MPRPVDMLIAGAGPAGAALALLLTRAGYRVTVVSRCREYRGIEGISRRSLQALRSLGLARAAACGLGPVARRVTWGGESRAPNQEWLLPRPGFDQALLDDLEATGIEVVRTRAGRWEEENGNSVTLTLPEWPSAPLRARWGIEARGRAAGQRRYRDSPAWARPALILRGHASGPPASQACTLDGGGWAWWARAAGAEYLQLALPRAEFDVARRYPSDWLARQSTLADIWQSARIEQAYLRPTQIGRTGVREGRVWRLGDAAMAVDPLSGQGIFNALSSAHGLVPFITGVLEGEPIAPLERFHQRRQDTMYWRFARAGRDFYRLAAAHDGAPYWLSRCHWPDHAPLHVGEPWASVQVRQGHAIVAGRLEPRSLVITPAQPLGIYAVAGQPLAPLVAAMQACDLIRSRDLLRQAGTAAEAIRHWWQAQQDWPVLPPA
ncbi:flavin-dependent monooxygenase QhpG [Billgrantia saliphila]|uniref:flavin-dependent monooxygenase QhpG n=1 Tax=Billgrantia saliphila TaxID=1848458 RepID=UPI000CE4F305|nr:FAD-dependent monooxygenase [Halomonas saliphila]